MSKINYDNQEIKKFLESLRQMKHSKLAFASLSSDDIDDIFALRQLTNNMPRTVDDPKPAYIKYMKSDCFMMSLYFDIQLDTFLQTKHKMISIDATGNIVKNQNGKRTFYYSAVFRSELTNNIIPVLEFFSEKHDIISISDVL